MKIFEGFKERTTDGGFEKACKYLLEKLGYECELTKATGDNGIDIIASKDGIDFGIQCKNWDNKVGSDEIRGLDGALKMYDLTSGIFMTTSSFTSDAIKTAEKLGFDLWNFTRIKTISDGLGFDLETLSPTRKRALKSVIFEHNKPVYEQMKQMLDEYGNAIITMGTGIGKTTTALEYCIQHKCRALVVGPSNIIIDGWNTNKTNKNNDILDVMTYQTFSKIYKDIDYNNYGVVIFDEVHHAGAETWGAGVKYLIENKIIPVIGLTATEERTDGINVADTLFDGHICEGMDILAGIKNEVIYPFTYIGVFYDPENVCQVEKDKYGDKLTETLLGKLDTALNNTKNVRDIIKKDMPKGNRKGIIFSADIESMDDDIKLIKDMYPKAEIKKIHSNMTYNEQKEVKEWFDHTKSGYICTVAMVNEGAHYEGVNTVFMLRKTSSELIFMQQLGRAITSVHGHKDPHTVIFDLVNSSKAIQNVKRKFKESGVEESVKAVEVTEEQYDAIIGAIDNGVITPVENDDAVEISAEDISVLAEATDVKIDLEKEPEKAREITRTIYVKDKVEFNTDYGKSKQVIIKDYTRPIVEVIEELHNDICGIWTKEQINALREKYPKYGTASYKYIDGKTAKACFMKAQRLGLKFIGIWDEISLNILKNRYPEIGADVHKELNGFSKEQCKAKADKLGLKRVNPKIKKYSELFTEEMDNIIIKFYSKEGTEIYKRFTGVTKEQCFRRANQLGIKYNGRKIFGNDYDEWTEDKIQILIDNYPTMGNDVYKLIPGVTKSAVANKAFRLELKCVAKNAPKQVMCIETEKIYTSISEAKADTGATKISECCSGKRNKSGGYSWKYVKE